MKIAYYFGKLNSDCDKMIKRFKDIGGQDIVQVANMKDPSFIKPIVLASVSMTVDLSRKTTFDFVRTKLATTKMDLSSITECSDDNKTLKGSIEYIYAKLLRWISCAYSAHLNRAQCYFQKFDISTEL